jgi:hypothetical protein
MAKSRAKAFVPLRLVGRRMMQNSEDFQKKPEKRAEFWSVAIVPHGRTIH